MPLGSVGKTADRQSKLQLLSSKPSAEFSAWASVHQSSLMAGDDALSQVRVSDLHGPDFILCVLRSETLCNP